MAKLGRNEPCYCGSGKKYKKCCLGMDEILTQKADGEKMMRLQSYQELKEMNEAMISGYELLRKGEEEKACDRWLYFWEELKQYHLPTMKSITEAEKIFQFDHFLYDWCQDLLMTLKSAAFRENHYTGELRRFAEEFRELFPETGGAFMHKLQKAVEESQPPPPTVD